MQHNHLRLNLKLFQSLQNKQTTYQCPVQQEKGTSLCMIFLRPSVAVIRLYSSHLVDPQTKSPALKSGCPESKTLATPYPFIGCKFSQRKVHNCKLKLVHKIIFTKQSLMHIYISLISFSHTRNQLIFQQFLKCLTRLFFFKHSAFFLFCHLPPQVPKTLSAFIVNYIL